MPELPEVETTRRGIEPHIAGRKVKKIVVRQRALRWPVPTRLAQELPGQKITAVERRGKYLLLRSRAGTVILHLGMSGSLIIVDRNKPPEKHDHIDIEFTGGLIMRYNDPRRFGSIHWTRRDPLRHPLLEKLGPEPLADEFDGSYLYQRSRGRRVAVKQFIMDSHAVVGIGNIYASECLYLAGIHPLRLAGRISETRYTKLVESIKQVLNESLQQGGTTLRNFLHGDGKPGYFQQYLRVYGRTGESCVKCKQAIRQVQQGQRSTFYCPHCQH